MLERVRINLEAPPIRSSQMKEMSGTEGSFCVDDRDSSTYRTNLGSTATLPDDACVNEQCQNGSGTLRGDRS